MSDVFSKQERSRVMAAVRSEGNKDTELRLASIFRENGIKGWRRHQPITYNAPFKSAVRLLCPRAEALQPTGRRQPTSPA